MATIIFNTLIIILVVDYIFEHYLDYLNLKSLRNNVPKELEDIYDANEYEKSIKYERETTRFSFFTSTFSFVLILLMLGLNGFAFVDQHVRTYITNPVLITVLFFGVLMFLKPVLIG